jgi:hypothetical protein
MFFSEILATRACDFFSFLMKNVYLFTQKKYLLAFFDISELSASLLLLWDH